MHARLPAEVKRAAEVLKSAGKEAYLVGGALRDGLLGLVPKDWDIATDAHPDEVMALFRGQGYPTIPTGLRFGTVTVLVGSFPVEITTFRAEGEYSDYRRPDYVRYAASIVEDLSRRDFTINALALNLKTGRLVDPFGGQRDLDRKVIRTVGRPRERFREDPLRMLRGFRLAAELGFALDGTVLLAVSAHADLVAKVARERVQAELSRLLVGNWAAAALADMAYTGLLFAVVPELREGWGFPQRHPAHSWSVFQHLVETVRYTPPRLIPRLAALFHDVGKPRRFTVDAQGTGHFYGHDRLSAELAGCILRRLRWDNRTRQAVEVLVRWHMFPLTMAAKGIRRLVLRVGEERVEDLLALKRADILATGPAQVVPALAALESFCARLGEVLRGKEAIGIGDLAVNGHDVMRILNLPPGPAVGKVLRALQEEVLADPTKNNRAYLEERLAAMARRNLPSLGE